MNEFNHNDFTPWPVDFVTYYKKQGYWQGETLGQLIVDSAEKYNEKTAIIDDKRSISYRQLEIRSRALAAGFKHRGIQPGDNVVVQLANSIEFFEVLFALLHLGAVPVLALEAHRFYEISHFCRISQAKAYVVRGDSKTYSYSDLAKQVSKSGSASLIFMQGDVNRDDGIIPLEHCFLDGHLPFQTRLSSQAVALMQLSGGTTNISKLIPRTHDDYYYSVRCSAEVCELTADDVYLVALPAPHNFPLSSPGALGVLSTGGTLVLASSAAPDVVFPLMEKHGVTLTALVPPIAMVWLSALSNQPSDVQKLAKLRLLQIGGAKLSHSVALQLIDLMPGKLQQVFGMAEGLVNYTRLHDDDAVVTTCQGRPMCPDDEIRVVDDSDNDVPNGEFGHLVTRGPYTIRGYYRAHEHNQKAFTEDGFYRTGDIVRLTEQGNIVVEGRAKDQINRGGEKIAAEEIENLLLSHPSVHDCALVAIPDDYLGERSCAYVVAHGNEQLSVKTLRKFLKSLQLADYKIPDVYYFVEHLPKTRFGKVNKQELRDKLATEQS